MFVADEPDLLNPDDEPDAFDALEFVQGGVDLFGEELPPPIPPCDIASDEGIAEDPVVDGEVDPDSVIEAAALADEDDDPDADGSSDADGEVEPVFAVAGADIDEETGPEELADEPASITPVPDAVTAQMPATSGMPADQRATGESGLPGDGGVPLALYRRYRPDTFTEVIGQEHVTEPLMRAIANNKVNHAYLFSGPRGCGKTTSARILARCLNCEQGPTPTPCGVCDSCVALATGGPGSIDVIEIDAASHGRVDDARELREGVYFAPVGSRYKIYIIDEAHMVTKEGFNALLKVVEEPPEHVKFIFATTEPEKVIGTIRSRTHHYPFRLVPPRVLSEYLEQICHDEGVQVERGVLPLVVRAGAGSVRDSLSVLDQLLGAADHGIVTATAAAGLLGYTPDSLLDGVVDAFAAGDGRGVFATIDKVIETGQDPRRFAEDLLERMRDLVIVAQVPDAIESRLIDVADDQAERLRGQAAAMGPGELTRAAEVIAAGLVQMRGTTAPRLHLELICSRVLLPTSDVGDRGVHARLDRLERRLEMGGPLPAAVLAASGQPTDAPAGSVSRDHDEPVTMVQQMGGASGSRPTPQHLVTQPSAPVSTPEESREVPVRPEDGHTVETAKLRKVAQQDPQPTEHPATLGSSGGPGTADVRRLWAQVLEEVKARKRFTHALVSQNAHVVEVRAGELLLGFSSPGTLERFNGGGSADVLRASIVEVIGVDLRITASVDGGPSREETRAVAQATSSPATQPTHTTQRSAVPPTPGQQIPAQQRPAGTPSAPHESRHAPAHVPDPVPEPEDDPYEEVAPDDIVIDDSETDAAELLARELGAHIIEENERS